MTTETPNEQQQVEVGKLEDTPLVAGAIANSVNDTPQRAMGRFEIVPIDSLEVDHSYQRDLSLDLVEKIGREYDRSAIGAITVSKRANGAYYIVNGQHRGAGALRAGETVIIAEVFEGLTVEEESALRLKGNTRRGDRPQERFQAQVRAGDPESLAIVNIVSLFDTKVNRSPDQKRGINAVASLEDIYRRDRNGTLLTRVLEFIQESLGEVQGANTAVPVLKGVAFMLERHGSEMDRKRMVEKIREHGVRGIHRIATAHQAALGGAKWMNYYRAFIEVYNERLSERARLEFRTTGWSKSESGGGWGGANA